MDDLDEADVDDVDDEDLDDDDLDTDTDTDTDADTQSTDDLHPGLIKVLRYIRTNPGCTRVQIANDLDYSQTSITAYLSDLRNAGHNIVRILGKGRAAHYKLQEPTQ